MLGQWRSCSSTITRNRTVQFPESSPSLPRDPYFARLGQTVPGGFQIWYPSGGFARFFAVIPLLRSSFAQLAGLHQASILSHRTHRCLDLQAALNAKRRQKRVGVPKGAFLAAAYIPPRAVGYAIDASTTTQVAIQRGDDGVLHVAFGACRSCQSFHHYKWFGKLICGHCNHAIPLPGPGEQPAIKRGCSTVAIPYAVEGGQLVVRGQTVVETFRQWYLLGAAGR